MFQQPSRDFCCSEVEDLPLCWPRSLLKGCSAVPQSGPWAPDGQPRRPSVGSSLQGTDSLDSVPPKGSPVEETEVPSRLQSSPGIGDLRASLQQLPPSRVWFLTAVPTNLSLMSASKKPNLDNIGAAEDLPPRAGLGAGFLSSAAGPARTFTSLQPLPAGLSSARLIFLLLPPCIPPHFPPAWGLVLLSP